MSAKAKNNSFANFDLQGWLAAICKCVVLWAGFPLSLRGGRKNKINPHQTAPPYQRSTNTTNPFFVIISFFEYRIKTTQNLMEKLKHSRSDILQRSINLKEWKFKAQLEFILVLPYRSQKKTVLS